jgi:iron complex outermembrane receptor protein/vitamin B12 transporter
MYRVSPIARRVLAALILVASLGARPAFALADDASISGTVVDPLGARVPAASVQLLRDGQRVAGASADASGTFAFHGVAEGRYQLEVTAPGFDTTRTDAAFVGAAARLVTEVRLHIGPIEEAVVVTAAASPVPESQVGAPVTVIDHAALDALGNTDLLEPMRTAPGGQIVQVGGRGGATSLFVRGGGADFNKVLLDGVPANDIGGAFDFADLATTGVDRVEVMRGSNSVLYGSDALTGVVSITTRRGQSRVPEAAFSLDGGNLATSHGDLSIGGAVRRVDYFADYSHLQTDNSVPNNKYRNNTFAARLGVLLGTTTSLSGTVRRIDTSVGSPNATDYYGIADDSSQSRASTYASIAAQSQLTSRWQSTLRFGISDQDYHFSNPTPTGQAYDPFGFGANYLGNAVTITGANGYSVTGRAILDYGGTYPSLGVSSGSRRLFSGDTSYHLAPALDLAGGVRVENEHGASNYGTPTSTDRNNYGAFGEARATAGGWLYVTAGLGIDHNQIFGNAATPRVSVAAYLRKPVAHEAFGDTKLTFNAGKGIKEPSLGQELSSLFALIPPATAASLGIAPIGPERSRSLDLGLEQGFAGGHGRARLAYFNNDFSDLIEFVSKNVLPQFGVPVTAANASQFGAYVNSQSNHAKGVEMSGEALLGNLRITGSYMYLDAVVTKSLSDGALSPAINPAFPAIPIGVYAPLVGARPFRRPVNSGSLTAAFTAGKAQVAVAGYFFGKQDDSTFLSDQDFGNSMLLPNKDMDAAYQKVDVSGSYRIHPRLRAYLGLENAFDQHYEAASGFPALPRTARAGLTVTLGGDHP